MAKRKLPNKQLERSKRRKAVHVDSLPWSTVQVPEMFDDAEGFFGLEEAVGVDIVRHGDTIQFVRILDTQVVRSFQRRTTDDLYKVAAVDSANEESDEFAGFDDLPTVTEVDSTHEANSVVPVDGVDDEEEVMEAGDEESALEAGVFAQAAEIDNDIEQAVPVDMSAWSQLQLSPIMITSISRLKFSKPTNIQARAIPEILEGHDVIGKAATGSGKTLAYGVPIVEKWLAMSEERRRVRKKGVPIALILSPTRELSHQITKHVKDLCGGLPTPPHICSVTGGLSIQKQQRQLESADIVIGTPGRLWEVMSSSTAFLESFKEIDFLVVDEADRLLTDGHFKEAEDIFKALDRTESNEIDGGDDSNEVGDQPSPRQRQTLVFSATFNKNLQQKLAGKGRYDLLDETQSMEYLLRKLNFRQKPRFIDVNPVSQMAEGLREGLVECGAMEKDLYLYSVLLLQPTRRTLVFTNSISSVRRITPFLQHLKLPAHALHSEMPQKARLRSIERFAAPKPNNATASAILVATDVAARGLDIAGIDLVIHYHVPRAADAYVHRSGRTARAESRGISILLCAPEEVVPTRRLIAKVHAAAQAKAGGQSSHLRERSGASDEGYFIQTADIDRRIVSRLKERVVLAKKIADAELAREKGKKEGDWVREAAEALGVEYDSDEMESVGKWAGRGSARKRKEQEARELTKADVSLLKAQLRELLSIRVNTGVSEKYLSGLDVDRLLKGEKGEFLGSVPSLGLDDL